MIPSKLVYLLVVLFFIQVCVAENPLAVARRPNPIPQPQEPARWLIVRSFVVFADDANTHQPQPQPEEHHNHPGPHDAHCAPPSAASCLRYSEPDRTDCLLLVARNLDRQVKRQQDNISLLTSMLQERARLFGLQIHHLFIFIFPAFVLMALLRCCSFKKSKPSECEEFEDEEDDEEAPSEEKTVTSFRLSGQTAAPSPYSLAVVEKTPPVVTATSEGSRNTSSGYPGVVFPFQK